MTEITLTHGKETALTQSVAVPNQISGGLRYSAFDDLKLPERYRIVKADKIEKLLDVPGSVLGSSEEIIFEQLQKMHPPPIPEATYLHRCSFLAPPPKDSADRYYDRYGNRRHRWRYGTNDQRRWHDGWLVMERPIVHCGALGYLQDLTLQLGAVLVTEDDLNLLGTIDGLREAGFTVVKRRFDLYQLNFNPRYTRQAGYREKVRQYSYRTSNTFPAPAIAALYMLFSQTNGPKKYPLLCTQEDERADFRDVVMLEKTVRRFWGPVWRSRTNSVCVEKQTNRWARDRQRFTLQEALEACLPFLHAEEAAAKAEVHVARLALCRIIRCEAKALKLKIPPKPRKPKKPVFKRKKKPKKRKKPCSTLPSSSSNDSSLAVN
jgi:hypothetical protein